MQVVQPSDLPKRVSKPWETVKAGMEEHSEHLQWKVCLEAHLPAPLNLNPPENLRTGCRVTSQYRTGTRSWGVVLSYAKPFYPRT